MAYASKRVKALELRKKGMSYSQIKEGLGVSKSTLSLWLREYPLSKERIRELRGNSEKRIERYRNTMLSKRESRRKGVYESEKERLLPLSGKELYVAGLLLYWGEGGKTAKSQISLSNTDPHMLRFYLRWLQEGMEIQVQDVVARLHLYADLDVAWETNYWSQTLGLAVAQFRKPYIKKSKVKALTHKTRGHGTCQLIVYGREYYERVMMGIQAICGEFVGLG